MGREDATTERIMPNRASRYSQDRLISEENAAVAWRSLHIEKTTSLRIEHVQKQRGMKRAMLRHVCARQQNRTTSRRLSVIELNLRPYCIWRPPKLGMPLIH